MKIKTKHRSCEEVMELPRPAHRKPMKPSRLLAAAVRLVSAPDLKDVGFTYLKKNMERAGEGPWLILMNHSSFLDLEMVSEMLKDRPYNIVCTSDGLVGKEAIMRRLGCIPTQKFVTDPTLIADLQHALNVNKTSVLMYPEASYSFDGTTTPLPRRLGILLRKLKVPVVMIKTFGSFTRDPLYNNLQKRKVTCCATMECLLTPEEIMTKSVPEMDAILDKAFDIDYFRWQKEKNIRVTEPFRADGLNRILFKCPCCLSEGQTEGRGTRLTCRACGAEFEMDELGQLSWVSESNSVAQSSTIPFNLSHIPSWYAWERECVRQDILEGRYLLDTEVDIGLLVDYKALYLVGSGRLRHDKNGFLLEGCEGKLRYSQPPTACYSLYSDYFWYEIGDVVCIGNKDCLYYCFPKQKDVVAKTRMAQEEIFKILKEQKRERRLQGNSEAETT
ncbi:MAG: 1-acyl-sn-glycerol-3-phosphate acyltransferase [Lachnospiraceae bacterium]|nr:1-acyl-sn-glycerol-3-phosphate acyltransferase [Lachnospiraceae bacterium]